MYVHTPGLVNCFVNVAEMMVHLAEMMVHLV